jgi:SAM-dependent methyltransferase
MDERVAANRTHWNELAASHERPSEYYDVDGFRAGGLSLRPLERTEVGDVRGKSLLHLQSHFGLDTLSWARLGARVTGVDFSEHAIERARTLASESGIDARFVCADLNSIESFGETFDIVFTSFGTTVWLPDLDRWARLIARSVAPTGFFYIVDSHPFTHMLRDGLNVTSPYFRTGAEQFEPGGGDYAVPDAIIETQSYEWTHTLGDIVTALGSAGLRIAFLHEHPFADWQLGRGMQRATDGYYRFIDPSAPAVPLMYSIKATL